MIKVLVTGACSGLGRAICNEFLLRSNADGFVLRLVRVDRTGSRFDALSHCVECDVRDPEQVKKLADEVGTLDILINNAGVNFIGPLGDFPPEEWDRVLDTNAKGIMLMSKAFLPALFASKGTIVNVVSNAAWIPMTHSVAYNASKAAAAIMTRQIAREITKSHGVTVFGICPNKLEGTAMSRYIEDQVPGLRGWTPQEAKEYQLKALPAGFETKPEWIAELLVWLLIKKHRHEYLTGCLLELGA